MTPPSFNSRVVRRHLSAFALLFLTACLHGAEPKTPQSPEAPKDYIVFFGTDIMADSGDRRDRVIAADGKSVQVRTTTGTEAIPNSRVQVFTVVRGTRFSAFKATINKVRASSLRAAFNSENAEVEQGAMGATREQEMRVQQAEAELQMGKLALGNAAEKIPEREQQISDATINIARTQEAMDDYITKRRFEQDNEEFRRTAGAAQPVGLPFDYQHDPYADGLELKLEISSPRPLEKAYLAVTILYVDPRQPERNRQRTQLTPIGRITEKPRKAGISLSGMPPGFHLVSCNVSLYGNGNGQEVATNLSQGQVAVTEEELFLQFFADYLSRNRGKTRSPEALLLAPAAELRQRVDPAGLAQMIYARVDKSGVATLSADEAGTQQVQPQILSVMRSVRFFPALENGKPVDAVTPVKLSEVLR